MNRLFKTGIIFRVSLSLLLALVVSIGLLVYAFETSRNQKKLIFQSSHQQLQNEVSTIITLKKQVIKQVVYDYTHWDSFVKSLQVLDTAWINGNISPLIQSFDLSQVLVFDTLGNEIHRGIKGAHHTDGIISSEMLKKVKKLRFHDYFYLKDQVLYKLVAATIHPTYDVKHVLTKPSGYLIVLIEWDRNYFNDIKVLTNSEIKRTPPGTSLPDSDTFTLNVIYPLTNWEGKPLANLLFSRKSEFLRIYSSLSFSTIIIIAFSFLFSYLLFYLLLRFSVIKPLRVLSLILKSGKIEHVEKLIKSPVEYQEMGSLVEEYFKQEEELLKAKDKAEEGGRLKTAFLANMSHEIRTPLNGILGFIGLLRDPYFEQEQKEKFLEVIESSAFRLLDLINDLVDISKIESGTIELSESEINLKNELDILLNLFKAEAEKKNLEISLVTTFSEEESQIISDKTKLISIISNLIKNAIKFTETGSVAIRCERIGNHYLFCVKDTGPGIHPDQTELIFERFRQGNSTSFMNFEGVGLGLAISKAFVALLGGKIWVETTLGEGANFYFTLPSVQVNTIRQSPPSQKTIPLKESDRKLRILIADDDYVNRKLLNLCLMKLSSVFLETDNGLDVVERCRNLPSLDLILMDMKMPGIDGLEATMEIRKFNKDVIIIAQSAYGFMEERDSALNAGCNDYISKPFSKEMLLTVVRRYFPDV